MTLEDMNAHLVMLQELITARELLETLQAATLSASRLDAMPRAPGVGDKVASLAIKIDEQTQRVKLYEDQVKESEIHVKTWIDTIQDNRTNLIFYLRFICGYEWAEVAEIIGGKNTENGVKSVCYRYLHSQGR